MKIRILAVGRKASGWGADAEKDYVQRLRCFADIAVELVAPEDEHSLGAKGACERESAKLLAKCSAEDFVIACDRRGKAMSSEGFADELRNLKDRGAKICCVIGGSHGLSEDMLRQARMVVSFSHLTFPHELFRVMLLEQLYRAFMIMGGRKYHK